MDFLKDMPIEVKKRKGESFTALLFRFNKKIKRSGVLKEAKKRRFHQRPQNKRKKRLSALHRAEKEKEIKKLKRYGYDTRGRGK